MAKIRRLESASAGFIKDVSDIIATEAWKNPGLFPDLSSDKTIFVFSDYSQIRGTYKTYSYFIIGRSGADYFNGLRKQLRRDFRLANRRMSYKNLGDKRKLRALPAFLSCAGAVSGVLVTFAVDARIKYMFAEPFFQAWPDLSKYNKNVVEESLRVVHFGAQAIMTVFSTQQNIVWFTDCDAIVANEKYGQLFGNMAEATIRRIFMPQEDIGQIAFGLANIDDGTLEIEDFIAIPDLVAGALCEMLEQLKISDLRIIPKLVLKKPTIKEKADTICAWIGNAGCPLKKFGIVFDKLGSGDWDFRPTFFRIETPENWVCGSTCPAQNRKSHISDPVRFDIGDYH